LRRFLNGEPIQSRPVGRVEKAWRWCGRHRAVSALAASLALLIMASAIGSSGAALWLPRKNQELADTNAKLDEAAAQLSEQLVSPYPDFADYKHDLATSYSNLGFMLRTMGQSAESARYYKKAIEVREPLVEAHESNADYQNPLATAYGGLVAVLQSMGDRKSAIEQYQKASPCVAR
jgi:tetratricopeptide (TPR) repeat protein